MDIDSYPAMTLCYECSIRMWIKGVHIRSAKLLDWQGPEIPAAGLPDSTAVREFKDGVKRFMILRTGKRLVNDRVRRLNLKHALEENYSRAPRGGCIRSRVTSWKDFDKLLEQSFGLTWRFTQFVEEW